MKKKDKKLSEILNEIDSTLDEQNEVRIQNLAGNNLRFFLLFTSIALIILPIYLTIKNFILSRQSEEASVPILLVLIIFLSSFISGILFYGYTICNRINDRMKKR